MKPILLLAALAVASGCTASRTAPRDNPRLAELYTQDQAGGREAEALRSSRDAALRSGALRLLDAGEVRTAVDHYRAAMILQHGNDSTDFRRAHDLASTAVEIGSERARWLAVASLDRYLISTGQPQRYATQFLETPVGWFLQRFDSTAVTDAERHRAGARTLAETRAFLAHQNGTPTGSLAPPPERIQAQNVDLDGGTEALTREIVYPDAARAARVEGRVLVQLTVLPDGTVGEAFVVGGLGSGLDEEALRVVRQARFVNHVGEAREIRLAVPFTLP